MEAPFVTSKPTIFKGEPAFLLSKEEDDKLATPFQFSLTGKFSKGRPKMDFLWHNFCTIGFKGNYSLGTIDHRHIHIHFDLEEDFHRCWIKGMWSFDHHIMRVLKWTPQFNPEHESSIVPVWVDFKGLPIHRFNEEYLRILPGIIGAPLKIDVPTLNLSRPSIARVCVEVDLLHDLPKRILLGTEEHSYFQKVTYENLPNYCLECRKVGHSMKDCRHGKPKVPMGEKPKTILTKQNKPAPATNVNNNVWKSKEKRLEGPAMQEDLRNKTSTSGLTEKEKEQTPIDVEDKTMPVPPISSAERKISKQQLSAIIQNNDSEECSWEVDEAEKISNPKESDCKQLAVFIPTINYLLEEVQIASLSGRAKEIMELTEYAHDDNVIGSQSENYDLQPIRLVVSDDEKPMLPPSEVEELKNKVRFKDAYSSNSRKIWVPCSQEWSSRLLRGSDKVVHLEGESHKTAKKVLVSAVYPKSTRHERQLL
ncbi:OLC1v1008265C1 [Oldenlandia corymbosa var. corymbosa]|uniref:OLC1v1008265C1 n=1 Tax=Oldenlandia corymbosa var. corymbosa TaxID=529605 RepID=A0AAV1DPD7_OLDCO|nr:OLC1v1008265C1 [Oldenlandia corymbosa var. corymbosa]